MWLNKEREQFRRAWAAFYGCSAAMGHLEPGLSFFRANSDGEGQALLMRAQQQARG